jgi:cytidine deaminase
MTKQGKNTIKIGKDEKRLLEVAAKALSKAYVLWGVRVGAAVLAEDGQVYEGCNVESWISGLGICAERNAINHAVLHGNRKIKLVAVVMEGNDCEPRPCGACLQYIHDFADSKMKVLMTKTKGGKVQTDSAVVKTIGELLPLAYYAK